MKNINIERLKNIHLIGIGGCGMSAIGKILHELKNKISGSDIKENSNTIRLRDLGVKIFLKHLPANLRGIDLVVISSAIKDDNQELQAAHEQGIPVIKRAQMLSFILNKQKIGIGVSGTHGKTTTTSMIAKVLLDNNLDPTFLIGGETDYVDGNARLGKGPYAVAEADESDGSFLELEPDVGIVTNVEQDHMEYFKSESNLFTHFTKFVEKLNANKGILITSDHPNCKKLFKDTEIHKITYGFNSDCDFSASDLSYSDGGSKFTVNYKDEVLGEATLAVPGKQNISNSLAAIAMGMEAGINFESIISVLQSYKGVKRRFQLIGEVDDILIIDDYAHHPTEIIATLKAARLSYQNPKRRIIGIFQPHRYTRTFRFAADFARAFGEADITILTDVYSAGEIPIPNVSGKTIYSKVKDKSSTVYIPKKGKIVEYILEHVEANDMVLTMGAGDIYSVGKELLARLKMKHETATQKPHNF
ncbi:UDP-N-acetylmuramate--L-alanine ligase [Candidatus Margulisiibacteriota bacterium]